MSRLGTRKMKMGDNLMTDEEQRRVKSAFPWLLKEGSDEIPGIMSHASKHVVLDDICSHDGSIYTCLNAIQQLRL